MNDVDFWWREWYEQANTVDPQLSFISYMPLFSYFFNIY